MQTITKEFLEAIERQEKRMAEYVEKLMREYEEECKERGFIESFAGGTIEPPRQSVLDLIFPPKFQPKPRRPYYDEGYRPYPHRKPRRKRGW